jgi:hypothetical protein
VRGFKGEASFLLNQESHVAHLLRVGEMTEFLIEGEKGMRREVWDWVVCHHPNQVVLHSDQGEGNVLYPLRLWVEDEDWVPVGTEPMRTFPELVLILMVGFGPA